MSLEKEILATGTPVRLKQVWPGIANVNCRVVTILPEHDPRGDYLIQDGREKVLPFKRDEFVVVQAGGLTKQF